jgi:hypothetical protein
LRETGDGIRCPIVSSEGTATLRRLPCQVATHLLGGAM